MIFAAGLGTRLRPLTNNKPKALVELNGKPFLQRNIEYVKSYGFDELIINVHHFADQIIDFLKSNDNFGVKIVISDERGELLETGGGLKKAAPFFDDNQPFLVINSDILTDLNLSDFYNYHIQQKALATLAVRKRQSSRYLLFNPFNRLSGWYNTKTKESIFTSNVTSDNSNLRSYAFSGIHIIEPKIFPLIKETTKFSIIKPYLYLASQHKINGYLHDHSIWMDLGSVDKLKKAENLLNQNGF